jgi:hypothetical protein
LPASLGRMNGRRVPRGMRDRRPYFLGCDLIGRCFEDFGLADRTPNGKNGSRRSGLSHGRAEPPADRAEGATGEVEGDRTDRLRADVNWRGQTAEGREGFAVAREKWCAIYDGWLRKSLSNCTRCQRTAPFRSRLSFAPDNSLDRLQRRSLGKLCDAFAVVVGGGQHHGAGNDSVEDSGDRQLVLVTSRLVVEHN